MEYLTGVYSVMGQMENKKIVITGGNSGIGKETAIALARMGGEVILAGHDSRKTAAAVDEIQSISGNHAVYNMEVDLSSLDSVRRMGNHFLEQHDTLDVLINNAGVFPTRQKLTSDGFEFQIGVNHLAHFLLTGLLMPALIKSPHARIITVTSKMHKNGEIAFDCFKGYKNYNAQRAYAQSKLANILFSNKLSQLLAAIPRSHMTSNAVHPGGVRTSITRDMPWILRKVIDLFFVSASEGARPSVMLASDPELESVTGKYFDKMQAADACPLAYDPVLQDQLWIVSEDLTGFQYNL